MTSGDVLNLSQAIKRLTFLTPSLITYLIQKIMQSIISFVMAWFINKGSSKNYLNLTTFT
jgi:hypothetical protein